MYISLKNVVICNIIKNQPNLSLIIWEQNFVQNVFKFDY